ncbi:MAG: leucine-rich repeat domain-containing protein [Treponema sp.]|nr:leucine-rich repeat domain-containing protein [Treponema sp.]
MKTKKMFLVGFAAIVTILFLCEGCKGDDDDDGISKVPIGTELTASNASEVLGDNWKNKEEIIIPDGVTYIDLSFAWNSDNLSKITLPDSVTKMHNAGTRNITINVSNIKIYLKINFTKSINRNFNLEVNGKRVTNLVIPDGIPRINQYAFYGCESLESVSFPNKGETVIMPFAFCECPNLTVLNIGNGVAIIGAYAFSECKNIRSVYVPDNVVYMGNGVFRGCDMLQELNLPFLGEAIDSTVRPFGRVRYLFSDPDAGYNNEYNHGDCLPSLENMTIRGGLITGFSSLTKSEGVAFFNITIGDKVTEIDMGAFSRCERLKSIVIPDTVTSIGENAFYNCVNLESITLGDGLSKIEDSIFENCSSVSEITIGSNVSEIGECAFAGCSNLRSITIIGNGDTKLNEKNMFLGCSSLSFVTIGEGVSLIRPEIFKDCPLESFIFYNTEGWVRAYQKFTESIDVSNPSYNAHNVKNAWKDDNFLQREE